MKRDYEVKHSISMYPSGRMHFELRILTKRRDFNLSLSPDKFITLHEMQLELCKKYGLEPFAYSHLDRFAKQFLETHYDGT